MKYIQKSGTKFVIKRKKSRGQHDWLSPCILKLLYTTTILFYRVPILHHAACRHCAADVQWVQRQAFGFYATKLIHVLLIVVVYILPIRLPTRSASAVCIDTRAHTAA